MSYPPISPGTTVITKQSNSGLREDWTYEAWADREWGVKGTVIARFDSRGVYYKVQHSDGTVSYYDPSELEVIR